MKQSFQIKSWSNLFFLVPLVISLKHHIYWYAIVIGLVFIVSSIFHLRNEKNFAYADVVGAYVLMIANLLLLFKGDWVFPYGIGAFISAVIALWFFYRQNKHGYNFNHGMWHIFSAATSFLSVVAYIIMFS